MTENDITVCHGTNVYSITSAFIIGKQIVNRVSARKVIGKNVNKSALSHS